VTTSMPVNRDERALLRALNRRIHNELVSSIDVVSTAAVRAENRDVKAALSNVVDLLEQHAEVHRVLGFPDRGRLVDAAERIRTLGLAISRSLEPNGVRLALVADTLPLEAKGAGALHWLSTSS